MANITVNANDIQQLVMQMFGNQEITAITTDNTVFLTATKRKNIIQNTAVNKLCGMFKNTNLLSSDDFSKKKEYEKKMEENLKYE